MRHKTKLLGIAGIIMGYMQVDPNLRLLLQDSTYAWLQSVVGVLTLICGYLNTQHAAEIKQRPDSDHPTPD